MPSTSSPILHYSVSLQNHMFSGVKTSQLVFLQQGYSKAAMLIAANKHTQAQALMSDLMNRLRSFKTKADDHAEQEQHRQALAECCVNMASTLLSRQNCEDCFLRVRQLLEEAISLDSLNQWAYFNLASYQYRTSNYVDALQNLHCSLSCLYLLKAVLSKDIENRNREIDLWRAISYAHNNLSARYVRLLMQLKQGRWKMAANEVELALESQPNAQQLQQLSQILIGLTSNSGSHVSQARSTLRKCLELVTSIPHQRQRLQGAKGKGQRRQILKQIEDKIVEFNKVYRQVNDLGSAQNLFLMRSMHLANPSEKRIHIISNCIQPSVREDIKFTESIPYQSAQLQAIIIERMADSKNFEESKGYGDSLFEISQSQNLQNSNKFLPGSLLSSLPGPKPFPILLPEVREVDNQNQNLSPSAAHKKMQIQAVQSQIQPLPQHQFALIPSLFPKPLQKNPFEEEDLLLDSLNEGDRDFLKMKPVQTLQPLNSKLREQTSTSLYPLKESNKVLELTLLRAELREDLKQKLVGIYANLEYNSGVIQTYKFRSRQVNGSGNQVEWGESLGFIRLAQDPKNLMVKLYKAQPFYYNDTSLGQGEIEVITQGVNKFPIYHNRKNVGNVSVQLIAGEQGAYSSFKRSVGNSNYSSSLKSESQSSQN